MKSDTPCSPLLRQPPILLTPPFLWEKSEPSFLQKGVRWGSNCEVLDLTFKLFNLSNLLSYIRYAKVGF